MVNISGGLGNQMFQYATAYSFAKNKGFELMLDISDYKKIKNREFQLNLIFSIKNKIATNKDLNQLLGYKKFFLIRRILKKLQWSSDKILIEKPYKFNSKILDIKIVFIYKDIGKIIIISLHIKIKYERFLRFKLFQKKKRNYLENFYILKI